MPGRRYQDGLHQALEAKEHVNVQSEMKVTATVTIQNYFRMYHKLSGMTGTAMTEEEEFREIYGLDVVEVPTNKPMIRVDHPDRIFTDEDAKFRAVIALVEECRAKNQPVLVGTASVEKSELLSRMLKARGVKHNVLNAKNHEREADIIAEAGRAGAVTIATNMAGRGTDIMLGGNPEHMAKQEMTRMGLRPELIALSTGTAPTEDQDIKNARNTFRMYYDKYKEEIKPDREKVLAAGGLYITKAVVSTISFAADPDVRATPANRPFSSHFRMTLCVCLPIPQDFSGFRRLPQILPMNLAICRRTSDSSQMLSKAHRSVSKAATSR